MKNKGAILQRNAKYNNELGILKISIITNLIIKSGTNSLVVAGFIHVIQICTKVMHAHVGRAARKLHDPLPPQLYNLLLAGLGQGVGVLARLPVENARSAIPSPELLKTKLFYPHFFELVEKEMELIHRYFFFQHNITSCRISSLSTILEDTPQILPQR